MKLKDLFSSTGLKRLVSSLLLSLLSIASSVPELAFAIPFLTKAAGAFGVVGVVHAANKGTTVKSATKTFGSIAAIIAALIALAPFVPALSAYVPLLIKISGIIGGTVVGAFIADTRSTKKK